MFQDVLSEIPSQLLAFSPAPPASDRAAWEALPEDIRQELVSDGEAALKAPWPDLPATLYMDFKRTGNRTRFEEPYLARRSLLASLVLAECAEHQGRFLDAILNGALAIAEESGWQLPAHNSYVRDTPQEILPDITRPVLDLFSCETGALLAVLLHLLKDDLDAISPLIAQRLSHELQSRIITPYLTEHFWWMGNGDKPGDEPMCNWTVWCTQNILLTTFTQDTDQETRNAAVAKAAASIDAFLKDYGEDGCCEEGVLYYRHAGLCLFNALDILDHVTDGAFAPLWKAPKIRNIADYIVNMHVDGHWYINCADCSAVVEACGAREFLFGLKTGSSPLADFAALDWSHERTHSLPNEINLYYRLQAAFTAKALRDHAGSLAAPKPPADLYYPSVGVFIARDDQFTLAVKAGDNGDSHNHNDTGSLTLFRNGEPFLIDLGVESYTAKTFSPQRYEIWTMQSAWHNLPSFGGVMQRAGTSFAASNVEVSFSDEESRIAMDIAGAYPPEAQVRSYRRLVRLIKGQGNRRRVEITDEADADKPVKLSLMLRDRPELADGIIYLPGRGEIRLSRTCPLALETIAITDPRLRWAWPDTVYRVLVPFPDRLQLDIF